MPTAEGLLDLSKSQMRIVLAAASFPGKFVSPQRIAEISGLPPGTVRPGLMLLLEDGWMDFSNRPELGVVSDGDGRGTRAGYRSTISMAEVLAYVLQRLKTD